MTVSKILKSAVCGACFALMVFAAKPLNADTIITKSGSVLTGTIDEITASNVVLKTDFSDDIKIKTAQIASITTSGDMHVRLENGTVINGSITKTGIASPIAITSAHDGAVTNLNQIKEVWAGKAKDPEQVRREHHWLFEAGMDVAGKTGNTEQLGTSASFRATLKSDFDTLQLYTGYNRQVGNHEVSADQFKAGADYQNNFSGRYSWYVRNEGGYDHVKEIEFYDTGALGAGYDVIKSKIDTLTFRAGFSYRYEAYNTGSTPSLRNPGMDFGLVNTLKKKTWTMVNRIAYTPAFEDVNQFQVVHESYIELPLANPKWKFRIGITNDYVSDPVPGLERLDTGYYARLLLSWR